VKQAVESKLILNKGECLTQIEWQAVRHAIYTISEWEKACEKSKSRILPCYGSKPCSKLLDDYLGDWGKANGRKIKICAEAVRHERRMATTYRLEGPYDSNGHSVTAQNVPAVHLRRDLLPRPGETVKAFSDDKVRVYNLALVLLHESGHISDDSRSYPSYVEMELPVYAWMSKVAGQLLELRLKQPPKTLTEAERLEAEAFRTCIGNTIQIAGAFVTNPEGR
jgi:hypothetical protein